MKNLDHPLASHFLSRAIRSALALVMFALHLHAFGTHYQGGSITYECLGPDSFRVKTTEYFDCAATPSLTFPFLTFTGGGGCGAPVANPSSSFIDTDITPISPPIAYPCAQSTALGFVQRVWMRDFKLPATTCGAYSVSFTNCCRNAVATGIATGQGYAWRLDSLRISTALCNNAPIFPNNPVLYITAGAQAQVDLHATDPDGDSLSYQFTAPLASPSAPVSYNPGYSPTAPLGPSWAVTIDAQTGHVRFSPQPGNMVINYMVINVMEWRNGQLLGTHRREMTVRVMPSCSNQLPALDSLRSADGIVLSNDTLLLHPGTSGCFDVRATDPDAGGWTSIVWLGALPGATFGDTNGTPLDTVTAQGAWGRVCWSVSGSPGTTYHVPYMLLDSQCLSHSYILDSIVVIVGDTGSVWPGDANDDLIANNLDILALGLAYGASGPARSSISNVWAPNFCLAWQDTIGGPVDKKHSDCDGSGLVDANDTLAINLNYGLTHTKGHVPLRTTGSGIPLIFSLDVDSAGVGDTITASIILGDSMNPASGLYGAAFTLAYDPATVDSASFSLQFLPNWLSAGSGILSIARNHPLNAVCEAAIVRTDHLGASGHGVIARASIILVDNIDGKRLSLDSLRSAFHFTQVQLIYVDGSTAEADPIGDSLMVYELIVDRPAPVLASPRVYPVPASRRVQVSAPGMALAQLSLHDLRGRQLATWAGLGGETQALDLPELPAGTYLISLDSPQGRHTLRLLVQ